MIPSFDCAHPDSSGITVEYYESISQVRFLESKNNIGIHQHDFYEMVLILRGNCYHFYRNTYIPLIPGDLFLIPPNQPHSYRFYDSIAVCNCQFYRSILEHEPEKFISDIEYIALQQKTPSQKRFQDIQSVWGDSQKRLLLKYIGNINSQGIIHLNRAEQNYIFSLFEQILKEQTEQKFGFERIKKMLLETILIQIKRVQMNQFEHMERTVSWQTKMIDTILSQIENDLAAAYDFNKIAEKQGVSISYFRVIFKNNTGLSPIEYLNRVRILRALELLQTTQYSIADIADQVGFSDPSYFARIFKKLIGYPPSHFKTLPHNSANMISPENL